MQTINMEAKKCPNCGAPINEVKSNYIDDTIIKCPYCQTIFKVESKLKKPLQLKVC